MARLHATFVTSFEGWEDDYLAFAEPWGFELSAVQVPVSVWYGSDDQRATEAAEVLLTAIPTAERHPYIGGHIQPPEAYRDLLSWLIGR